MTSPTRILHCSDALLARVLSWSLLTRILLALLALSGQSLAGPGASLEWDSNVEPDVRGYRIYIGPASGNYTRSLDAGNKTTAEVEELVAGFTYYFVVTAYNDTGLESPPSNEVVFTVPMPESLQITYLSRLPVPLPAGSDIVCETQRGGLTGNLFAFTVTAPERTAISVYSSMDLQNWQILGSFSNPTGRMTIRDNRKISSRRFYRMSYAHLDPPQDD